MPLRVEDPQNDHETRPSSALTAMRLRRPLVQCLTNRVVSNFTANALLAVDASPVMADIPGEAELLAPQADGVLINVGTPDAEQRVAAVRVAEASSAWVLDPVAVGVLPVRTALIAELLGHRPAIIRGNASEILALAGEAAGGRGVDAAHSTDAAASAAQRLARELGATVAVSGPVDYVTDGTRAVRIGGGSAFLTRVTGGGCSLGAVMAALLSVSPPLQAAVAASALYAAASERAADGAAGPGSFAVAFLDQLDAVSAGAEAEASALDGRCTEVGLA